MPAPVHINQKSDYDDDDNVTYCICLKWDSVHMLSELVKLED